MRNDLIKLIFNKAKKNKKNLVIGIEPFKNGLANTAYYC